MAVIAPPCLDRRRTRDRPSLLLCPVIAVLAVGRRALAIVLGQPTLAGVSAPGLASHLLTLKTHFCLWLTYTPCLHFGFAFDWVVWASACAPRKLGAPPATPRASNAPIATAHVILVDTVTPVCSRFCVPFSMQTAADPPAVRPAGLSHRRKRWSPSQRGRHADPCRAA
jgi:hypothetical protein